MVQRYDLELLLKKAKPFDQLPAKDRKKLVSLSREREFSKGETLFHEGRPSDSIWLMLGGRVNLVHHLSGGKVQTSCVMTSGETFCCLPALDQKAYPATAVAATKARVLKIPTQSFHEMMRKSPEVLQETLCLFCDRLRQVETRACSLSDPAEKRIARMLLTLEQKFGKTIPLTKQEISELVGTTVETAIRIIGRFQKEGWVRSSRGKIEILKPDSLKTLTL